MEGCVGLFPCLFCFSEKEDSPYLWLSHEEGVSGRAMVGLACRASACPFTSHACPSLHALCAKYVHISAPGVAKYSLKVRSH